MEENSKERYEAPEIVVVEIKTEGCILQGSNADWEDFGNSNELD